MNIKRTETMADRGVSGYSSGDDTVATRLKILTAGLVAAAAGTTPLLRG